MTQMKDVKENELKIAKAGEWEIEGGTNMIKENMI